MKSVCSLKSAGNSRRAFAHRTLISAVLLLLSMGALRASGIIVDDTVTSSITYSGSWTHGTYPQCYAGTESYTQTANDSVQYTFSGTSIAWLGARWTDRGMTDVYIDTVYQGRVDAYGAADQARQLLFEKTGLTNASHTIKLICTGLKNSSSSNCITDVDAFIPSSDPAWSGIKVNDTDAAITYNTSWGYYPYPGTYLTSESYSDVLNDYAQFTFTGTAIRWIGALWNNRGKTDVYLDGIRQTTVDAYSASNLLQQVLFERTGLSNSSHTIKLVCTHTQNINSSDYYTDVDAFEYGTGAWPASQDYSTTTQGLNNWYYQQRAIGTNTYATLTSNTSGAWRGGNGNWIADHSCHPDNSYDIVRTWVAPYAGTITIRGRVFKIDTNPAGNGVVASVVQNTSSTPLWSKTIAATDWLGYYTDNDLASVTVSQGDQIHFVVNNNGNYGADETGWNPSISYVGSPIPSFTAYYVAASGSDSDTGTSSTHPWQTIAPLNKIHNFGPGVQILFNGGDTFAGGLDVSLAGASGAKDEIASYGTGNATLNDLASSLDTTTDIIQLGNSNYTTVHYLNLYGTLGTNYGTSSFSPGNLSDGLKIYSTTTTGSKWESLHIDQMTFKYSHIGAFIDTHGGSTVDGADDLEITNSVFDSNWRIGAILYGYNSNAGGPVNQSSNVYIGSSQFLNIKGSPTFPNEAGAIFVSTSTGITIEKNLASNIGGFGQGSGGGSSALAVVNDRNFKIQHNEIHNTLSSTSYDGSAIDADQDSSNGEIAYNLTYDNGGPAIETGSYSGLTNSNIVIHDNMSYDDVRGNTSASYYGAITLWGSDDSCQIFNNTIYVDQSGTVSGSTPSAICFLAGVTRIKIWNNILKTTQGMPMIVGGGGNHLDSSDQFIANLYDSSGGSLLISNDDTQGHFTSVTSLAAWQADGQEKIGSVLYGVANSAGLSSVSAPSGYLPSQPVSTFTNFDLTATSAARGQAVIPWSYATLTSPMTVQTFDFHGNTGNTIDIGADTY